MLMVIIENKNKPGFGANQGPSGLESWPREMCELHGILPVNQINLQHRKSDDEPILPPRYPAFRASLRGHTVDRCLRLRGEPS